MSLSADATEIDAVPPSSAAADKRNAAMWVGSGVAAALAVGLTYADGLAYLVTQWLEDDNYSHGLFVPFISLAIAWWRRNAVVDAGLAPSWWGVVLVLVAGALLAVGELTTLFVLQHLSLWVLLVGCALCLLGMRATGRLAFPLGYLLTAVPLPQLLEQNLSAWLQLVSSALGVEMLQTMGITAFREGNVIDLGPIQLQVVEACSGLRFLIPLMSLALLSAYLFRAPMWKRVTVFVCSMPVAILLNGFRIAVIGLLVEWFGAGAAEGFLHLFEGWVVFLLSLAILLLVMRGLSPACGGPGKRRVPDLITASPPEATGLSLNGNVPVLLASPLPAPWLCGLGLVAVLAGASPAFAARDEIVPARLSLANFPLEVDRWRGVGFPLEKRYIETLKFDDYLLADYRHAEGPPLNVYIAYYRSQRKGQSAHSPRTCMPGGGWEITSLRTVDVPAQDPGTVPLRMNRAVIQKGDAKQVVYYWFKQRDRMLTDEWTVKAFLVQDAVTRNRTDGALVRLTAPVQPGREESEADAALRDFADAIQPMLGRYVPD